ncbi:MAG: amino acid ABC transporter permease [Candidatus Rokubacteria bacterium]|nr:amino acid ABC transporter permease [Candidatus Rokubacteria bacterium]
MPPGAFLFLLQATWVTIKLSATALVLAFLLGLIFGWMRASGVWVLKYPSILYIEVVRGIPLLVTLLTLFYLIPIALNQQVPDFIAVVAALSLYGGAFAAEIVRAGIQSVGRGQWEAARSSGLNTWQVMRCVVMPQALLVIIPPGVGLFVGLIKDSSLATVVGYVELMKAGDIVRNNPPFYTFGPLSIVALNYFIVCLSLSRFGHWLERRLGRGRVRAA